MLSSYSKEVLRVVTRTWSSMKDVLFLLNDRHIGELETDDQEAVCQIIRELDEMARKLIDATGPILTKKSTPDER